ncbi:hypothetical protein BDW22DRAFT_1338862 [Trametopsis cervina]|nr:hypothetical protein BDW22DRAFT_1338862 [Trametopsis cervina]
MSTKLPSSLAGFTLIPIQYSPSVTHVIYARAHTTSKKGKAKDVGLPEGRTLFLVNVPPDATERELTQLFKHCGTVEKVVFAGEDWAEGSHIEQGEDEFESDGEGMEAEEAQEDADLHPRKKRKLGKPSAAPPPIIPLPERTTRVLRKTGRSAHVVFLDESSLSRALASPTKPRAWPQDTSVPSGLEHYLSVYRSMRPPLDVVKAHANSWMEHFDWEQAKKKQQSKYRKGEAVVDDDGFTLVTRGGAYGQTVGGGVRVASKTFQREGHGKRSRKAKKEPKEKDAFYAFQIHEQKRKELMDLKRKWEEDKEKVEKLKESRKFKPY